MLRITIPAGEEQWDEINQMFIYPKEQTYSWSIPLSPFQNGNPNGASLSLPNRKRRLRKRWITCNV